MNVFSGHISDIKVSESLSMVSVRLSEHVELKAIIVETPETASYLKIENAVEVLFKETEVIISKEDTLSISIQNKVKATIKDVTKGMLLSKLILKSDIGDMIAILATEALDEMMLTENQEVIAMIKVNEIMISK
ncbi:tobe domain protein [Aquimarina sp. BL5]|uniref:TOBE domain-containing protein n=1 Tax=Aquimarina sp. BL5 TaxID=1714860 RepID=UPI000E52FD82|nr:TOBE domain-containing protein [Aquimarina sp. BL5]AXT52745.1 tobe domain protein [Aquimarina sp. BL5]RKN00007.1 tobe domain protein [Aquimarina sp. BL5]